MTFYLVDRITLLSKIPAPLRFSKLLPIQTPLLPIRFLRDIHTNVSIPTSWVNMLEFHAMACAIHVLYNFLLNAHFASNLEYRSIILLMCRYLRSAVFTWITYNANQNVSDPTSRVTMLEFHAMASPIHVLCNFLLNAPLWNQSTHRLADVRLPTQRSVYMNYTLKDVYLVFRGASVFSVEALSAGAVFQWRFGCVPGNNAAQVIDVKLREYISIVAEETASSHGDYALPPGIDWS